MICFHNNTKAELVLSWDEFFFFCTWCRGRKRQTCCAALYSWDRSVSLSSLLLCSNHSSSPWQTAQRSSSAWRTLVTWSFTLRTVNWCRSHWLDWCWTTSWATPAPTLRRDRSQASMPSGTGRQNWRDVVNLLLTSFTFTTSSMTVVFCEIKSSVIDLHFIRLVVHNMCSCMAGTYGQRRPTSTGMWRRPSWKPVQTCLKGRLNPPCWSPTRMETCTLPQSTAASPHSLLSESTDLSLTCTPTL